MIHHIVMWKLKEADKEKNAQLIKEKLESLKSKISEIQEIHVGINLDIASPTNFDVVLDSKFNTFADLDAYQVHPAHVEVVGFVKSVVEQRVAIDYEK